MTMSLEPNRMLDFNINNKLGSGAFSEVFKVTRKSDKQTYALKKVKMMKLSQKEKENALNEVRILASIQHPNIASYKEAFFEPHTNCLCIVMEYCDNGDLQSKINNAKKISKFTKEDDIWSIFYQMVLGLQCLHKKKIIHRDIKCANVFLTKDGLAKLGDLNVSKVAKSGILQTQTGTPYYASPEVWQDKPYDNKSDIWSLGCVLYELVALNPPFTAKDMKGLYHRVLKGVYPKIPQHYSSDLNAVLKAMLQIDPKKRPNTDQILHMPVFIAKHNELKLQEQGQSAYDEVNQIDMLGTIKLPSNLRMITSKLPESQYEDFSDEEKKVGGSKNKKKGLVQNENLEEISEENENDQVQNHSDSDSKVRDRGDRRPYHRKPKVKANIFNSPSQRNIDTRQPNPISKIIPSDKAAMNIYAGVAPGEDPMQGLQKRMIEKNRQEKVRNMIGRGDNLPQVNNDVNGELQVIRIPKKQYVLPGSSPEQRSGIQDVQYIQNKGKTPLYEKREKKKAKAQRQADIEQLSQEQGEGAYDNGYNYKNNKLYKQSQQYSDRGHNSPSVEGRGQHQYQSNPQLPSIPGSQLQRVDDYPPAINQKYRPQLNENYDSDNSPNLKINGNETPMSIVQKRNQLAMQNASIANIETHNAYKKKYGEMITNASVPLTRARSKDSLPMNNNIRERYLSLAGAGNIIAEGRREQQNLALMDRYGHQAHVASGNKKNKDNIFNMYRNPSVNVGKPNYNKYNIKQYIPMSQHGERNKEEEQYPKYRHGSGRGGEEQYPGYQKRVPSNLNQYSGRNRPGPTRDYDPQAFSNEPQVRRIPMPRGPAPEGIRDMDHKLHSRPNRSREARRKYERNVDNYEQQLGGGIQISGRKPERNYNENKYSQERPQRQQQKPVWWG